MTKTSTITVSYSELKDSARCSYKHRLGYIEGWSLKERHPMSALAFGTAWHEVMETYYEVLRDAKTWGTYREYEKSPWRAARDLILTFPEVQHEPLEWMLTGYNAYYGMEPGWTPRAVEVKHVVPLPQLKPDLKVNLKVKVDLVIEDKDGDLWADDHKSASPIPSEDTQTDNQLPLYIFALRKKGMDIFGARYSYALKPPKLKRDHPLEKRFARYLKHYSDEEVDNAARDAYKEAYARYHEDELWGRDVPRTKDRDCKWMCDFRKQCLASQKGLAIEPFMEDLGFEKWRDEHKAPLLEEDDEFDDGPAQPDNG